MKPKRNIAKILFGVFIILTSGINLGSGLRAQENTGQMAGYLTMGILSELLGFYLLYRGIYPREK